MERVDDLFDSWDGWRVAPDAAPVAGPAGRRPELTDADGADGAGRPSRARLLERGRSVARIAYDARDREGAQVLWHDADARERFRESAVRWSGAIDVGVNEGLATMSAAETSDAALADEQGPIDPVVASDVLLRVLLCAALAHTAPPARTDALAP